MNDLVPVVVSFKQFRHSKENGLMKKVLTVVIAVMCIGATGPLRAGTDASEARLTAGTVKVTVNYTGKGTVDATHKLWVWIFDTPNIGAGSQPVDQIALDKNGIEAVFSNVAPGQVWIAVAFDQQGLMSGNEPPPSGSPISVYMGTDGAPMAVTPGDKALVNITFDDTMKMP
ncbi:MAG TPA: hypothetical protein VNT81_17570 [Vicinamibacterales bacterium]|nr:hypothetical protein [Vicinamibacterales bacterium]